MTNRDWSFSINDLQRHLGLERLVVLNDFSALALAIPTLAPEELQRVGGGEAICDATVALLGPGTGLGVSGLVRANGLSMPIAGEGGHASLSAAESTEERVISILRSGFEHVSAERVLSGAGLVNLYRATCEIAGRPPQALSASDVTARALTGGDAECRAAVEFFFAFLGNFAGNLALTLGALGGVYIGGGIVPRLGDWIARSSFRERFERKGRFAPYLAKVPTWVITASVAPALRGANRALDESF
jgi:glucokinase